MKVGVSIWHTPGLQQLYNVPVPLIRRYLDGSKKLVACFTQQLPRKTCEKSNRYVVHYWPTLYDVVIFVQGVFFFRRKGGGHLHGYI